jgi:WD40 repeat protein
MAVGVRAIAFSPDGTLLVTTGGDNTAILCDTATGRQFGEPLAGHVTHPDQLFPGVEAVAFSPDGRLLATGGLDRDIRLWEVTTRKAVGEPLRWHPVGLTTLRFDQRGAFLFSGDQLGNIQVWDVRQRNPGAIPSAGITGGLEALS